MKINKIMATGMEMTDAIRKYCEEKFLGLAKFTTHIEPVAGADIEIGKTTDRHKQGKYYKAEVNVEVPGGLLRAVVEDENLYAAIDKAKDEIKRQLIEDNKRRRTQKRKGQRIWKALTSITPWARHDEE